MAIGLVLLLLSPALLAGASATVSIRNIDGAQVEGRTELRTLQVESKGKTISYRLPEILSVHNGAPASEFETERITAGLSAIQGSERKARDLAVEELTSIGLPALTPLLRTIKDTDQHEPRPLYRLFERLIPSSADDFDRTLSLVRIRGGGAIRGKLPEDAVEIRTADGSVVTIPWAKIRSLAVMRKSVQRSMPVHSLRHATQIEYLDTGVVITAASKVTTDARGFVRLSWDADGWASDADGLKKPGAPNYKTNLVDGHPFGALLGRIGANSEAFLLGKKAAKTGLPPGRLTLAVNDNRHWQNNVGTYSVTMTATDAYDVGDAQ